MVGYSDKYTYSPITCFDNTFTILGKVSFDNDTLSGLTAAFSVQVSHKVKIVFYFKIAFLVKVWLATIASLLLVSFFHCQRGGNSRIKVFANACFDNFGMLLGESVFPSKYLIFLYASSVIYTKNVTKNYYFN